MFGRIAFVFVAALLTGCAAGKFSTEREAKIRNVAVVSLVPDTAIIKKIGLTVFNNEIGAIEMQGKLNDVIVRTADRRLKAARPAWNVKSISYDQAALTKKIESPAMGWAYSVERVENELAQLARANDLDAIFVLSAWQAERLDASGVGLYMATIDLTSIRFAKVHANLTMAVVGPDGKSIVVPRGDPNYSIRIDPDAYGLRYRIEENQTAGVLDRVRLDILNAAESATNRKFAQMDF